MKGQKGGQSGNREISNKRGTKQKVQTDEK